MTEHQRDDQYHERREEASARSQSVNAVNQVKGICDADDPKKRG